MGNCDACGNFTNWESGTPYTADEFRTIVRLGFEPPSSVVALGPAAVQGWKNVLIANSTTGWLLCPICSRKASRFLPKSAGSGPAGNVLHETMPLDNLLGVHPGKPTSAEIRAAPTLVPAPASLTPSTEIIRESNKVCPTCKQEIEAGAITCPYCEAKFEVAIKGYCSREHAVMSCSEKGICLTCGQETIDKRVESTLIEAGKLSEPEAVQVLDWHVESRLMVNTSAVAAPVDEIMIFERTGEGVGLRFSASIVDQITIGTISGLVFISTAILRGEMSTWINSNDPLAAFIGSTFVFLYLILFSIIWVVYFAVQESVFGMTLGKIVGAWPMQLKVIRIDGSRLPFWRAFLRALIGLFETNLIGAIIISATQFHQRLGDLAAGTLVVDRTKIHRVRFAPESALFEFLDGEQMEIFRITEGIISTWLGIPQWMVLHCVTRAGRPVKIRAKITRGLSVFGHEGRMQELQARLEQVFHIRMVRKLEWWRIIAIIVPICIVLLILLVVVFKILQ